MDTHQSPFTVQTNSIPQTETKRPTVQIADNGEYLPGSILIYGMHGKCEVRSIETRTIGTETARYYKLEILKSALSRSTKQSPAIWVPIAKAKEQGLRERISDDQIEVLMKVLESREYFFDIRLSWQVAQVTLENAIRLEGAIGLAKALSFLLVLKKKLLILPPDINRFAETVQKNLLRELSEAAGTALKNVETRVARAMRHKTLPDH